MTSSERRRKKPTAAAARPAPAGKLLGYARVSTADQSPQLQLDALDQEGCARVWVDHASGTKASRPQWDQLLDYARDGDTIVVWRLDRAGRSLRNLIDLTLELEQRGIGLKSLHESIDTTTASGRLMFQIMGALAEFERGLLSERTQAGLLSARARGRRGGRQPKLTAAQDKGIRSMYDAGKQTIRDISDAFSVSASTVYRSLDRTASPTAAKERA